MFLEATMEFKFLTRLDEASLNVIQEINARRLAEHNASVYSDHLVGCPFLIIPLDKIS